MKLLTSANPLQMFSSWREPLRFGRQLLAVAVLCILVTAPPGAALIAVLGPRLLEKAAGLPGGETRRVSQSVDE